MAENDLIEALRALTAGMAGQQQQQVVMQQHQNDLQQQQNATFQAAILAQQADLQALLTAQQQHHRQQHLGQQDRLRSAATASVPTFSGAVGESLEEWETILGRVAAAENWDDGNKRRVAIGKLTGVAAHWHDQSGHLLLEWAPWIAQLRATFEPRLTLAEWCLLVENRRQLPGESGAQYALEKARLCRRCPHQLAEADIVPYLVRGVLRSEHMSVLLNPIPVDVATFIDTIRRLENIGGHTPLATPPTIPPIGTQQPDLAVLLKEFGGQITSAIDQLKLVVEKRPSPPYVQNPATRMPYQQPSTQPSTSAPFRPRRPISEITCYRCYQKGHYQSACPVQSPTVAAAMVAPAENELADPLGQGRQ